MDGRRHPLLTLSGYVVGYFLGLGVAFGASFVATWLTVGRRLKARALELSLLQVDLALGTGLDNRSGHDERSRKELPQESP